MIGRHGTKDGKMNPYILRRFTTPTLGMADNEFLLVPLILLFHLQFCACEKKMAIWKPSEAQLFPLIRVQHCICTAHIHQWTPYGALCSQRAVPGTREVAEPAYHFSLQAAAGGCCCTPHELQLTEWGEGLSHKGPRSYLCAPLPGLSSSTNTPLLFHPRYQAPVSHSWAQTGPSTTPQTVRRMVHGWWQACNLTASFKKC